MTERETQHELAAASKRFYLGTGVLIILTVIISLLFTGGIAYAVQNMVGGGEEISEGTMVDGVREFHIEAAQWDFSPAAIKLNPGEKVRLIITSADVTHGFAINELGINVSLPPNERVIKEVTVPDNVPEGTTYTLYCSVFCGIGHPYMKGSAAIGFSGIGVEKLLPYIATTVLAVLFAGFVIIGRRNLWLG